MAIAGSFKIDQVVHGYDRGHREIVRSIELDDRSRAMMLIMSDLLIDRILGDQDSYLVCYPLPGVARHVLARTWSAGPDYRPGSVWTHSLLIDYPSLAQIHDLGAVAELLRNPSQHLVGFEAPLFFAQPTRHLVSRLTTDAARAGVAGVYSEDACATVRIPTSSDALNEALALALWRQAWPSLRRDFAFVTGCVDKAVPIEAGCSLFFSHEQSEILPLNAGQLALFHDLSEPGPTALRTFMSRYVVESKQPRRVASKVAQIWVDGRADIESGRVTAFAKMARSECLSRLKRDLIVAGMQHGADASALVEMVVEFCGEPFACLPESIKVRLSNMAREHIRSLIQTGSTAIDGTLGHLVFQEILHSVDLRSLAEAADCSTRFALFRERPEIVLEKTFWPNSDLERVALIEVMASRPASEALQLLELFGQSVGSNTTKALISWIFSEDSSLLMDVLTNERIMTQREVISLLAASPHLISAATADRPADRSIALENLAIGIIVTGSNVGSISEWISFIREVMIRSRTQFGFFFSIVAVTIALMRHGEATLDFATAVFERVLSAAKKHVLDHKTEQWLGAKLPSGNRGQQISSRLISSAVEVWPVRYKSAGALLLCHQDDNVQEVIGEVELRLGHKALKTALHDQNLPQAARKKITDKLASSKRGGGFFGF